MRCIEWHWGVAHVTVLAVVACGGSSSMDGTRGGGSAGSSASTSPADTNAGAPPDCADEDRNACLSRCSPEVNDGAWTSCCTNGSSQQLPCAGTSDTTPPARDYCAEGFGCGVVPPKTDTNNAQVQCDACAGLDAGLVTNSSEGCCCAVYFVPIPASEYEAAFDCTRL